MSTDLTPANDVVAYHEDKIRRAEERIFQAMSLLTSRRAARERSTDGSFSGAVRPSVQVLVWD